MKNAKPMPAFMMKDKPAAKKAPAKKGAKPMMPMMGKKKGYASGGMACGPKKK